jgi:hypothetical protein
LLQRKSADDLSEKLKTWATCDDINVTLAPEADAQLYEPLKPINTEAATAARSPTRVLPNAGWTASFSALTRHLGETKLQATDSGLAREERWLDSQIDNPVPPADEQLFAEELSSPKMAQAPYNEFPAGSAYGTLLHDMFEWQLKEAWPLLKSQSDLSADVKSRWQHWWQTSSRACSARASSGSISPRNFCAPVSSAAGTRQLAEVTASTPAWRSSSWNCWARAAGMCSWSPIPSASVSPRCRTGSATGRSERSAGLRQGVLAGVSCTLYVLYGIQEGVAAASALPPA